MLLNCGVGEDSWESLGLQGDPILWSWNSNTLATWCEELTHLKRPWFWERLKVGGEGDDRGWDGWLASPTQWTWVWVNSRSWWGTGRPGVLQFMGSQRVWHDWVSDWWLKCVPIQSYLSSFAFFLVPSLSLSPFLLPSPLLSCQPVNKEMYNKDHLV